MGEPRAHLVRHGETAWTLTGQHTGVTDIPLTPNGRRAAADLAAALAGQTFALVLTSPMQRARDTCALAGFGGHASADRDLVEWNYGEYEGLTSDQIEALTPDWLVFRDGCPGGEQPDEVGWRVDRLIARVRAAPGDVALFGHGHIFRVMAARWLGLPVSAGSQFLLETATVSILGYYRSVPAIEQWNARASR